MIKVAERSLGSADEAGTNVFQVIRRGQCCRSSGLMANGETVTPSCPLL
ncbi:hypothetical protein GLA29479_2657 [Lysobacter antibioticus]|nr:hypothetical protein GLA29479_2657 [Lysobacter antibioticus]